MKKRVLVIDGDKWICLLYAERLNSQVEIICAHTLTHAKQIFLKDKNIDAIVLEGNTPSGRAAIINAVSLVWFFRETYSGPIIAASSNAKLNKELFRLGCDHRIGNLKNGVFPILKKIFNLEKPKNS